MRIPRPSNDNPMAAVEIASRLDWVRPVFLAMRANAIPDDIAQRTMAFLLARLDDHLDGKPPRKLTRKGNGNAK